MATAACEVVESRVLGILFALARDKSSVSLVRHSRPSSPRPFLFRLFDAAEPFVRHLPAKANGQDTCPPGENGGGGAARGRIGVSVRSRSSSHRGCAGHVSGMYVFMWEAAAFCLDVSGLAQASACEGVAIRSYRRGCVLTRRYTNPFRARRF